MGRKHEKRKREEYESDKIDSGEEARRSEKRKKRREDKEESREERRRRKLEKKTKKKELQEKLFSEYTNDENPFGDDQLTEKFVWKKKAKKDKELGKKKKSTFERQQESLQELQKVKENRKERELEQRMWEEEQERLARERDAMNHDEWNEKENEFNLKQAKIASSIRVREGRAKHIDMLLNSLKILEYKRIMELPKEDQEEPVVKSVFEEFEKEYSKGDFDPDSENFMVDLRDPNQMIKEMYFEELELFIGDVEYQLKLDKKNHQFWKYIYILCEDVLKSHGSNSFKNSVQNNCSLGQVKEIKEGVKKEIDNLFLNKSFKEICNMKLEMRDTVDNPDPSTDIEFYESILNNIEPYEGRAYLKEKHLEVLETHNNLMEQHRLKQQKAYEKDKLEKQRIEERIKQLEKAKEAALPVDDTSTALDESSSSTAANKATPEEIRMFKEVANYGMEEGDEVFKDEVVIKHRYYSWDDKYRPRKPKYFNRVHSGFEWNQYNQTHYDKDNPPPRTIKGYKFNLFYPDLIDKTKTPTYHIEAGPTKETKIVRFHSGPPYEDIAFTIVNREWEKSHRRGFRCTFERGIFKLHFNFKRYRYRR